MIRINLLPHREAAKKARREQFYVLFGLVALLAAVIIFAVYTLIETQIEQQNRKNDFLKQEIAVLDKQLEEIKQLREKTNALLARKKVIEDLQRDRGETVYLLSELTQQVPEGVYLKSLKQDGLKVNIAGYAQSNARVSALMRNLEAPPRQEQPVLIDTKAEVLDGRRVNEFSMSFSLTRAAADENTGEKAK